MQVTDQKSGINKVDALRQQLMDKPLLIGENSVQITFSSGISVHGRDGGKLDELLIKADRRLYLAKQNGRNQVIATDDV